MDVAVDAPRSFLLVYLIGIMLALLGALIATREPHNSVGWLMIGESALMSVIQLFEGYGYAALALNHGTWPLGSFAAWLGTWIWVPALGFISVITVRFPNGNPRGRWRAVDWIYLAGTALFALVIGVSPRTQQPLDFAPFPSEKLVQMYPYYYDPVPALQWHQVLNVVQGTGLILIVVANALAAASLIDRYRRSRGDERLQIKWLAYSGTLGAAAVAFGGVAWSLLGYPLYLALTPLEVVALSLPLSIGVAILRYRLYDIDLIINRTLVYGGATALLGALYTALITFFNRYFIATTGQRSDAAYVLTAFAVVVAFSPIKDWLQHQVDRRIRHTSPAAVLDGFRGDVEAVVSVLDVDRVARRLLDQAIEAFDARSAALYLDPNANPRYEVGHVNGHADVEVDIRFGETRYGRLVMGGRRGNIEYTAGDVALLQRSADSVGEALALAAHLGFRPLSKAHSGKEART